MRPGYVYFQAPVTQLIIWQTPNLAHYSSYAESQLVPTTNAMLNYVLKPTKHESFHGKYTSKKYLQVCQFLLLHSRLMTLSGSCPFEFANLDWWNKGTEVTLTEELPTLKAQIRAARAA